MVLFCEQLPGCTVTSSELVLHYLSGGLAFCENSHVNPKFT